MRINEDTLLEGEKVVLVPYNADHVPRYHQWMCSPELQKLTSSDPLTLEQEYDMQRCWREDDDKCTFIILDKQKWADPSIPEQECMVGDVNIFLTDPSDPSLAELEIMIAVPCYRGKGLGKEVTRMMMCYGRTKQVFKDLLLVVTTLYVRIFCVCVFTSTGVHKLGIQKFEVKIGLDNKISIAMFKKFHFRELSISEVFQEVILGVTVNEALQKHVFGNMDFMLQREYGKARDSRQAPFTPLSL
ncbi:N-acetyltransferase 9 isoform X2 [Carassius carassius]|nr:N-acetyltransferase 9 isoform X2 [Carassius carassius]